MSARRRRSSFALLFGFVVALGSLSSASVAAAADEDPWTSSDKTKHFAVSAGLATAAYTGGALLFDARGHALIFGGAVTLAIGAGKELADLAGAGDPSWKDFTWDVIGTTAGLALAWSLDLAIRGVSDRHPLFVLPRVTSTEAGLGVGFTF